MAGKIVNKGSRRLTHGEQESRTTKLKGVTVTGKKKNKKSKGLMKVNASTLKKRKIEIKKPEAPEKKELSKQEARWKKRGDKKKLKYTKSDRQSDRAAKLHRKADAFAGTKKGERLRKRARRNNERSEGHRKTVAGTALKGAGRVLAALSGAGHLIGKSGVQQTRKGFKEGKGKRQKS